MKKRPRTLITEEQYLALNDLAQNGPFHVQYEQRALTLAERECVAPRVKRIEQLRVVLAGASHGDAWINERTKELHNEERELRHILLEDLNLYFVTWQDDTGRERQVEFEFRPQKIKVTIR